MEHEVYEVISFKAVGPYRLVITFDDGTSQEIDFEPILYGRIYGPLRDPALFRQVTLDSESHTLVWPNGADFDPETLRNWPLYRNAWIDAARSLAQHEVESTSS